MCNFITVLKIEKGASETICHCQKMHVIIAFLFSSSTRIPFFLKPKNARENKFMRNFLYRIENRERGVGNDMSLSKNACDNCFSVFEFNTHSNLFETEKCAGKQIYEKFSLPY